MNTVTAVTAVVRLPIDQVDPGPNVRGQVGDVDELALSIRTIGQQTPLLVCELEAGRWQVIDGHRRLAAAKRAGLPHVDAIVRQPSSRKVRLQQQLAMHAHGKAFDPIAEAKALYTLFWDHKLTREQIAAAVGKSPNWVRDRIGLLQLPDDEQAAVAAGRMPLAHALLSVKALRAERDGRPILAPRATPAPTPRSGLRSPSMRRSLPHCPTCRCADRGGAA